MQHNDIRVEEGSASRLSLQELNQFAQQGHWYDAWLHNLLADLPGFSCAMLAVKPQQGALQPVSIWPRNQSQLERLGDLVDECLSQLQPLVVPPGDAELEYGIAYPVVVDDDVVAVFSGYMPLRGDTLEDVMTDIEKNVLWIESRIAQDLHQQQQLTLDQQKIVIDGFVAVGRGEALKEAALKWVDTLARDFDCDRVSLGHCKLTSVSLGVISGSTDYALNSVTAKQIVKVMQESCDQRRAIAWPELKEGAVALQAEKLSIAHHNACVLSVPVYHNDDVYLVLTFERPAKSPFSQAEIDRIEANLSLVGVAFEHRRLAELSLWGSLKRHCKRQFERLLAPGYVKRKVFFISLTLLLVFFSLARGDYLINADAVLEPKQLRIVSAPFNGYLKSSSVRAGDRIERGDVLAYMEDNDLRLEKIKAMSRLAQNSKQYTEALAKRDRAQAQIFFAQMEQAKASLASAESKLKRSELSAPFDALIVDGDLSQRLGGSVSQGEELFQLSPLAAYRLILYVNEYRIIDVEEAMAGRVVLSSMPSEGFDFVVESITPITEVRDGGTVFRVEAYLQHSHPRFRPGLVGVAKVSAGERLLIDIWTGELRKWLALKLWSFWG
ncbi:MAG: efflux RND transporter periplasmic adaptor subunit [Cellvibrionaceae bacterium]